MLGLWIGGAIGVGICALMTLSDETVKDNDNQSTAGIKEVDNDKDRVI